jgi:hypothetical protein
MAGGLIITDAHMERLELKLRRSAMTYRENAVELQRSLGGSSGLPELSMSNALHAVADQITELLGEIRNG